MRLAGLGRRPENRRGRAGARISWLVTVKGLFGRSCKQRCEFAPGNDARGFVAGKDKEAALVALTDNRPCPLRTRPAENPVGSGERSTRGSTPHPRQHTGLPPERESPFTTHIYRHANHLQTIENVFDPSPAIVRARKHYVLRSPAYTSRRHAPARPRLLHDAR